MYVPDKNQIMCGNLRDCLHRDMSFAVVMMLLLCISMCRCTVIIQVNFTKAGCTCTMYSILQCTIICGYY